MARSQSLSCSLALSSLLAVASTQMAAAQPAAAQPWSGGDCVGLLGPADAECRLALATARAVQERVGTALWGGNAVPGTASTLGMRIGSMPRISASAGVALVPIAVPPLLDRTASAADRGLIPAFDARAAVGLLPGWSPLPTVGGVMSLDLLAGLSVAPLPAGAGFRDGAAVGWLAGARLGVTRESFTLPGISVTGSYGRSTTVTLGDPTGATSDGYFRGHISDLNATLAVTHRISALRLTGGAAFDRYASGGRAGFTDGELVFGGRTGRLTTDRRSAFGNAAWTFLIFHTSFELGWQDAGRPDGLPAGVSYDPARWWAGLDFRVSI